jgi:hypothetical protein
MDVQLGCEQQETHTEFRLETEGDSFRDWVSVGG